MASPKNSTRAATKKASATVLQLVSNDRPAASHLPAGQCLDAAAALAQLMKEAIAGRLSGFCYVAITPGSGYIVDAVGECESNPTFSRGMVRALDDKLARMVTQ